jgi:hypothetical protein
MRARRTQMTAHALLYFLVTTRPSSVALLTVITLNRMSSAAHFSNLSNDIDHDDDYLIERSQLNSVPHRCGSNRSERISVGGARHISSPFWSETTLGCGTADRAVVEGPALSD